jgi:hypothetical protein
MAFKSLLDPSFKYRSAALTDVRKTFERIRRELAEQRSRGGRERGRDIVVIRTARPTRHP